MLFIILKDVEPIEYVRVATIPALFVAAKYDNVVPPSQVRRLFDAYGGTASTKFIIYIYAAYLTVIYIYIYI